MKNGIKKQAQHVAHVAIGKCLRVHQMFQQQSLGERLPDKWRPPGSNGSVWPSGRSNSEKSSPQRCAYAPVPVLQPRMRFRDGATQRA